MRGEEFKEDGLFRHIEPSHAFHLDLPRLSNFAIRPANTSQLQVCTAARIDEAAACLMPDA